MASSIIGVSTIYQSPSLEVSKRMATPLLALPFSEKTHFTCLKKAAAAAYERKLRLVSSSAIATPISVLSEEAFKGLTGGFSGDSFVMSETDDEEEEGWFESEGDEGSSEADGNEQLAIAKLGLPKQLLMLLRSEGLPMSFLFRELSWFLLWRGEILLVGQRLGLERHWHLVSQ